MVSKDIKILCSISILIFITYFTILSFSYGEIKNTIATHFDINMQPNRYGYKSQLFYICLANLLLLGGIFYGVYNPQIANYPVTITELNKKALFKKMQIFLCFLCIVITLIFGYIVLNSIYKIIDFQYFIYILSFIPIVAIYWIKQTKV